MVPCEKTFVSNQQTQRHRPHRHHMKHFHHRHLGPLLAEATSDISGLAACQAGLPVVGCVAQIGRPPRQRPGRTIDDQTTPSNHQKPREASFHSETKADVKKHISRKRGFSTLFQCLLVLQKAWHSVLCARSSLRWRMPSMRA